MRLARPLVLLALVLAATPALAYTIYLNDGSRIVAKEKYVLQGDKAIITLPSGTKSSIAASEIDVQRTDNANQSRLGTAMVIEGGEATELKETKAAPKPKPRLQDLIRSNEAGMRQAPPKPQTTSTPLAGATQATRVKAEQRLPFGDAGVASEIRGFVTARGVNSIEVYRGAETKWPLLVYETGSEGAVFKALVVSANALLHVQGKSPGAIDGFEVLCETPDGGQGGRFELSPQLASELIAGRYEITRFYVENVVF
ncbi:MAG TPA: hypothetical protein VI942_07560 [Thermoanaerobaculia bacterium]|nr:hypothetical protein [Thermoanaerobaculia bacterium]